MIDFDKPVEFLFTFNKGLPITITGKSKDLLCGTIFYRTQTCLFMWDAKGQAFQAGERKPTFDICNVIPKKKGIKFTEIGMKIPSIGEYFSGEGCGTDWLQKCVQGYTCHEPRMCYTRQDTEE